MNGIGDTIRISLTGDPVEEIHVGKDILRSLNLLNDKIKIVSCPTCGRCNIDLINMANEVEERIKDINEAYRTLSVPASKRKYDRIWNSRNKIAGGKGEGLLFKKGEIVRKIKGDSLVEELLEEINKFEK